MPPVGQGANLAMLDAADLALAIAADPGHPAAGIANYQTAMFERATDAAYKSAAIAQILMSEPAPSGWLSSFGPLQRCPGE